MYLDQLCFSHADASVARHVVFTLDEAEDHRLEATFAVYLRRDSPYRSAPPVVGVELTLNYAEWLDALGSDLVRLVAERGAVISYPRYLGAQVANQVLANLPLEEEDALKAWEVITRRVTERVVMELTGE